MIDDEWEQLASPLRLRITHLALIRHSHREHCPAQSCRPWPPRARRQDHQHLFRWAPRPGLAAVVRLPEKVARIDAGLAYPSGEVSMLTSGDRHAEGPQRARIRHRTRYGGSQSIVAVCPVRGPLPMVGGDS